MSRRRGKKLYMLPFSPVGVAAYHTLRRGGVRADGFYDERPALAGKRYDGRPVIPPDRWDPGARILTAVIPDDGIHRTLRERGFGDLSDCQEVFDGDPEYRALEDIRVSRKNREAFLREARVLLKEYHVPGEARDGNRPVLQNMELSLTQRCTLKCRRCSNLMQYVREPVDMDAQAVCRSCDDAFRAVGFVRRLGILGGEPLLYRDLHKIIGHVARYRRQIGLMKVVTNGTILPSDGMWEVFRKHDVTLSVSDYGPLSSKKDELIRLSRQWGVRCQINRGVWVDCCRIIGRTEPEETRRRVAGCIANCHSVWNGRLYFCPFLAHADTIGAIPADAGNYVKLGGAASGEIARYLDRRDPLPGCGCCSGHPPYNSAQYPPAEQISAPLPYTNCR